MICKWLCPWTNQTKQTTEPEPKPKPNKDKQTKESWFCMMIRLDSLSRFPWVWARIGIQFLHSPTFPCKELVGKWSKNFFWRIISLDLDAKFVLLLRIFQKNLFFWVFFKKNSRKREKKTWNFNKFRDFQENFCVWILKVYWITQTFFSKF